MWFADWAHVRDFDARQAASIAARGATPEISWEPWDSASARPDQPRYRLRRIIAGDFDAYIARWARQVAAYGRPVRLRFAQEMNGRWFPWAERANGNRRGEFVRAWRHVHAIFARAGARNVRWVWCPVAGSIQASQYPGRTQVDVLGLAGFNGGTAVFRRQWRSFRVAFGPSLDFLHGLGPAQADRALRGRQHRAGRQQGGLDPRHVPRAAAAPGGPLRRVVQRPQGGRLADRELPQRAAGVRRRGQPRG